MAYSSDSRDRRIENVTDHEWQGAVLIIEVTPPDELRTTRYENFISGRDFAFVKIIKPVEPSSDVPVPRASPEDLAP